MRIDIDQVCYQRLPLQTAILGLAKGHVSGKAVKQSIKDMESGFENTSKRKKTSHFPRLPRDPEVYMRPSSLLF